MQDLEQQEGPRKRGRPRKAGGSLSGAERQRKSIERKRDDASLLAAKMAGILIGNFELAAEWYDAELGQVLRRVLPPVMARWFDDLEERLALKKNNQASPHR